MQSKPSQWRFNLKWRIEAEKYSCSQHKSLIPSNKIGLAVSHLSERERESIRVQSDQWESEQCSLREANTWLPNIWAKSGKNNKQQALSQLSKQTIKSLSSRATRWEGEGRERGTHWQGQIRSSSVETRYWQRLRWAADTAAEWKSGGGRERLRVWLAKYKYLLIRVSVCVFVCVCVSASWLARFVCAKPSLVQSVRTRFPPAKRQQQWQSARQRLDNNFWIIFET